MNIFQLTELIYTNHVLPDSVLTIGNFDGVHLGHQAMLERVKQHARLHQLASMVMIFEPQPREFFAPASAPARLTNLAEKAYLIDKLSMDTLIVARFDESFRNLSAQEFAQILSKLGVKRLVLGDDFRFGHDRMGDSDFFQRFGIPVDLLPTITDAQGQNERVSSTRVRDSLLHGSLTLAKQLLGRDYSITGEVLHGDKIGRTLNFPTANIALNRIKPALHGIFGVEVVASDGTDLSQLGTSGKTGLAGLSPNSLFGAANIGTRPAVDGDEWRLEVFFPEFEGDLYGQTLTVTFLHFLHGEQAYPNLDALKAGIAQDVQDLLAWRNTQIL